MQAGRPRDEEKRKESEMGERPGVEGVNALEEWIDDGTRAGRRRYQGRRGAERGRRGGWGLTRAESGRSKEELELG